MKYFRKIYYVQSPKLEVQNGEQRCCLVKNTKR